MNKEKKHPMVVGIGGAGGEILSHLSIDQETDKFSAAVIDFDEKNPAALGNKNVNFIQLGQEWECSEGCGGDSRLAERIAAGTEERILETIEPASIMIVTAGLGAGCGAGVSRVLARLARDHNVPALFVLTLPFSFEGNWPRRQAEKALSAIRDITEHIIVIHNDLLFSAVAADIPARQAFLHIDQMLAKSITGLLGIAWSDWILKADFATIRSLLRQNPGRCRLGFGAGTGNNRWRDAVEEFVRCPLLGGRDQLRQSNNAVITVGSNNEISASELRECMTAIQQHFPEETRLLVGAYTSPIHAGEIQLTGLCCQLPTENDNKTAPAAANEEIPPRPTPSSQKKNAGGRQRQKEKAGAFAIQEELPFQEEVLGVFSGNNPTIFRGENLDVPTFQRKGIQLDLGRQIQKGKNYEKN